MAVRFMATNRWDAASALTASSAATGYPAANTQHRHKTRAWRATGKASEWLKVDLGSALSVQALVLTYTNLTVGATLTLQGNATDSWGTPSYSQAITVTADMVSRGQVVYHLAAAQTYRWWRVTIVDTGIADAYVRIGRVFLGPYVSPSRIHSKDWKIRGIDPSEIMQAKDGAKFVNARPFYNEISVEFRNVNSADRTIFEALKNALGRSVPFWISLDSDSLALTTYYVSCLSGWELTHVALNQFFTLPLELEEER